MRTGVLPLGVWGTGLIGVALFGTIFFDLALLPTLLLAGAGTAAISVGVSSRFGRRRNDSAEGTFDTELGGPGAFAVEPHDPAATGGMPQPEPTFRTRDEILFDDAEATASTAVVLLVTGFATAIVGTIAFGGAIAGLGGAAMALGLLGVVRERGG